MAKEISVEIPQKLGIKFPYVLADHSWVAIQRPLSQYSTETLSHPWILQHYTQDPSYEIGLYLILDLSTEK